MSNEKLIEVEKGRFVLFRATAFSPIIYNQLFKDHDFFKDVEIFSNMATEIETDGEAAQPTRHFTIDEYKLFTRLAYCYAYQGISKGPFRTKEQEKFLAENADPWAWLDTFSQFSMITILPEIVDMWQINEKALAKAKNQHPAPPEK